jgi:hypothetical protein
VETSTQQSTAVYAVEHPDHICSVHFISVEDEYCVLRKWNKYALWTEKLCTLGTETPDEQYLLSRCSRPMIPMHDDGISQRGYIASDWAQQLLAADQSEWEWVPGEACGPDVVLRFGDSDPELVVRPYDRFDERTRLSTTVDLYIQERTPFGPACTVSLDEWDERYVDGDFREKLGDIDATRIMTGILEVRFDDVNRLVRRCSRPMIPLSTSMPPTYVPYKWLEKAVAKIARVH